MDIIKNKMRLFFVSSLLLLLGMVSQAQTMGAVYRVEFANKNNTPYSISNPNEFLTQRALERREKMNIAIDERDIPVVQAYIDSLTNIGASVLNRSRWFNSATVLLSDTSLVATIRSFSFVSNVIKTKPYLQQRKIRPFNKGTQSVGGNEFYHSAENLKMHHELNRLQHDYGMGKNQANMIGVEYLHGLGFQGQGMVIAILDAGFYHVNTLSMFDSLRLQNRLLGYKDFVLPGNNLFEESTHGMSVASTIVGNMPGKLVGTAPKASVWLLRCEDANSEYIFEEDNWVAAAEFADSVGADVINSSLGYTRFDDPSQNHSYSDMDGNTTRITRGADIAASKGILVVNSAGNSGNENWHYIGAPADADSILTIGAVDKNGKIAYFSSFGPSYDGRVKPTICAQGKDAIVSSISDGVYPSNGTSFSSPIMAGAATCLWQANKNKSNMEIIDALIKSGSQYSNPDSVYGYGIPNMAVANMILNGIFLDMNFSKNKIFANPNPFEEDIDVVIYLSDNANADLSLVDNNGKVVWSNKNLSLKIGYNYLLVSGLGKIKSGIYFLRINSNSWSESVKLLKN